MTADLVKTKKSFIFIDILPIEIEDYILKFYYNIRDKQKQNLQTLYSNNELVCELYRRCKGNPYENKIPIIPSNLVYSNNDSITRLPLGYLREIYRLYDTTIEEMYDLGLDYKDVEGHSLINYAFVLNNGIQDKLVNLHFHGIYDFIYFMNKKCNDIINNTKSVKDMYDKMLIDYWSLQTIEKKYQLINMNFNKIKYDFINENGVIQVKNRIDRISNSIYRIMRFSFINDFNYKKIFS
jgi:hypothetical protein